MVARLRPDLVTMDIHMPKLDGLRATEKIMAYTPTPILVVSSSVRGEGVGSAFDALALGALEVIKKPEPRDWADLDRSAARSSARSRCSRTFASSRTSAVGASTARPHAARVAWRRRRSQHRRDRLVDRWAVGAAGGARQACRRTSRCRSSSRSTSPTASCPGSSAGSTRAAPSRSRSAKTGVHPEAGVAYFAPTGANMVVENGVIRFREPEQGPALHPERRHALRVGRALLRQALGRRAAHRDGRRRRQRA